MFHDIHSWCWCGGGGAVGHEGTFSPMSGQAINWSTIFILFAMIWTDITVGKFIVMRHQRFHIWIHSTGNDQDTGEFR